MLIQGLSNQWRQLSSQFYNKQIFLLKMKHLKIFFFNQVLKAEPHILTVKKM